MMPSLALLAVLAIGARAQPAPLPDAGPGRASSAAPARLDDASKELALTAARVHILQACRGGPYVVRDPVSGTTLRLSFKELDGVFPVFGGAAVRARFSTSDGRPAALDLVLERAGPAGWRVRRALLWQLGDDVRFYYDRSGRPVLYPAAPASKTLDKNGARR